MRERRTRLSLIAVAMLAVVVPGAAAGLAEHSSGLAAGGRPVASYSVTQEPAGSYRATLAAGDRVYAEMPTLLPADETGASGVLASQARSERTKPLGVGIVPIFPDSPSVDNCVPFGIGDPNPDFGGRTPPSSTRTFLRSSSIRVPRTSSRLTWAGSTTPTLSSTSPWRVRPRMAVTKRRSHS